MNHLSKPCGRASCLLLVEGPAHRVTRVRYCSQSCATRDRIAHGWRADHYLTAESRSRGARKGGHVAGEARHQRSLAKAVQACLDLLPGHWAETYGAADLARVKVLLGRAYLVGQLRERQRVDTHRRYEATKGTAA